MSVRTRDWSRTINQTLFSSIWLLSVLVFAVAVGIPSAFAAGEAEDIERHDDEYFGRGDLDDRYADVTGDLVADPPADESEWLDPDTLIFAFSPGEDPATYREAWGEFLEHLEDVTGRDAEFFSVETYAAQIEAMRAGRLHIAGVPTGAVPTAVNQGGFVPRKMMAEGDGSFGYSAIIVTAQGSNIQEMDDLVGQELAFVAPASNSGYMAPVALLNDEYGWLPDEEYETTFTGDHEVSILGAGHGDYDAAATASGVFARMIDSGVIDSNDYRVLYESDLFPDIGYGHVHNLHPDLADAVREAFRTFDWAGSGLEEQWGPEGREQFIPITYEEHWEPIRVVEDRVEELGLDD